MGVAEQVLGNDGSRVGTASGACVGFGTPGLATVLVGAGVRHAGAIDEFRQFIEKFNLPFVSSYGGVDILPTHHNRIGVLGTHGTQEATDVVLKSDTLVVLGCRLSVNTRGYADEYVDGKRLIIVDIDPSEHEGREEEVVWEDVKAWLSTQISG